MEKCKVFDNKIKSNVELIEIDLFIELILKQYSKLIQGVERIVEDLFICSCVHSMIKFFR